MSDLFAIYDPKGELFEVPSFRLPSLKALGWSSTKPVVEEAPAVEEVSEAVAVAPVKKGK